MARIALIGTAGRDKSYPLTRELWDAMTGDVGVWVNPEDVLISGGAAWADHLAVHAWLQGWCAGLELYLPAPLEGGRFAGPFKSAGSTANYYHQRFSGVIGEDTLAQVAHAIEKGAVTQFEPVAPGVGAMFVRNKKVAQAAQAVVAYTFGEGDQPADGGTLDTWKQVASGDRLHVPMSQLVEAARMPQRARQA